MTQTEKDKTESGIFHCAAVHWTREEEVGVPPMMDFVVSVRYEAPGADVGEVVKERNVRFCRQMVTTDPRSRPTSSVTLDLSHRRYREEQRSVRVPVADSSH